MIDYNAVVHYFSHRKDYSDIMCCGWSSFHSHTRYAIINIWLVNCKACMSSVIYQEDIATFEIGHDSNTEFWKEYVQKRWWKRRAESKWK